MMNFDLSVSVMDILLVVIGLIIMILCIRGFSLAGKREEVRAGSAAAQRAAQPLQTPGFQGVSPDVVAAMTAAIASVWQGEQGFTIRHIKRIHNAPAWNRAGREEQTYSRF